MKKEIELFTTVGNLIKSQSKNITGEVVDEVYFFEGNQRHTLQKIKSETGVKSHLYIFQTYNLRKGRISSVIPNIFPEHLLCQLLKKAREKGWGL